MFILKTLLILLIYFAILYEAYWFTNKINIPEWLNYKPFNCQKCHTLWLGVATFTVILIQTRWYIPSSIGIVLSILTGIALYIDERNKGL